MKKEYDLEGISCGGCANNVKVALLQHPDITEVEVEVHPPKAVITHICRSEGFTALTHLVVHYNEKNVNCLYCSFHLESILLPTLLN